MGTEDTGHPMGSMVDEMAVHGGIDRNMVIIMDDIINDE